MGVRASEGAVIVVHELLQRLGRAELLSAIPQPPSSGRRRSRRLFQRKTAIGFTP